MRTYLYEKLRQVSDWLKLWLISGKRTLTARAAGRYLKTDVVILYRLKSNYCLPSHKTQQQLLYFIWSYVKIKDNLEVDKSGKEVSRACFLCHDPEVYINEKYRV